VISTDHPEAGVLAACVEAAKPGITRLVTITAVVGLILAGLHYGGLHAWDWVRLGAGVVLGTALAAGGANALNQWYESDRDARMRRTQSRPIPSGRLTPRFVFWQGLGMVIAGTAVLYVLCGVMPALIALASAGSYVILYTPLKPLTIWNTLIGAIPGALPTMIGTAAVAPGEGFEPLSDPIGLALFSLMMVWQIPHFIAIAWMCRADYALGGFRMLPAVDTTGKLSAWIIIGFSLLLVPVSASVVFAAPDLLGWPTIAACVLLGLLLVGLGTRVALHPTEKTARAVFIGSIIHLPVLLIIMVAEAVLRTIF
jgi:protoheme IX farnesyltransferase